MNLSIPAPLSVVEDYIDEAEMNLGETIRALEAKGVTVAINLGVHQQCALNSNCPLAIQLRRLITDSGVTLEQLLEGFHALAVPEPMVVSLPQFNAKLQISVANKLIELDMKDVITAELEEKIRRKLGDLDRMGLNLHELGRGLHATYANEIAKQRDVRTLPQLCFPVREVIGNDCLITSEDLNYIFLFPVDYNPQYMIRQGIRYKLPDEDIATIRRQAYIEIVVSSRYEIFRATVLNEHGDKLHHYHGDDEDCWGAVHIPNRWDGRLITLYRLARSLSMSLKTINRDSLMVTHPRDMPRADELFDRCTELGREGQLEEPVTPPTGRTGRGWGTGWRRRG